MDPEFNDLDERIKRHYERQVLGASTLEQLKRQIDTGGPTGRRWRNLVIGLQIAAVLAIVAGGVFLASRRQNDSPPENPVSRLAARDVAVHHRKQFSLDYRSESMEQLSQDMTKLDFSPVLPRRMRSEARLVGARYCAVLGQIAAQFRFIDADGKPCTLYQTRCQGEFSNLPEAQFNIDGTRVELWREAGLLMVMAFD